MNKKIDSYTLVCATEKTDLWFRNGKFYCSEINSKYKKYLCSVFDLKIKGIACARFRVLQRMFRLSPRCGIFVDKETALVSFHGRILKINTVSGNCIEEHFFRDGMNNPLSFSRIRNVRGFNDCIVYGEYFGNHNKEEVRILGRNEDSSWVPLYSFPPNTINHIHGIVPDQENSCLYVLTGDTDEQSGIWEFKDHFKHCEKILFGGQQNRSCVAFPYKDGIVYATDTPLQGNGVYFYHKNDRRIEKLMETEGPCIYGRKLDNNRFVFSTSVEPDSRMKGWRYRLTYRRGQGVRSWFSCVYEGNPDDGFKIILRNRKDYLPMLLFGFGTFLVPDDQSGHIRLTGQSIKGLDGKTIIIGIGENKDE